MKRYGGIYEKIYSIENLTKAFQKTKKNESKKKEIQYFQENQERLLLQLQESLKNKTFRTSQYNIFNIIDKGKEREISDLPFYPDRIVHWAIILQIEKIFLQTFIFDTYAAIPKKGTQLALKRMNKAMRMDKKGTLYALKFDIKKFFPNVDRDILSKVLSKKIKDKNVLWLLNNIIYSVPKGIPIGNYTSQYFGNFYLSYFDHWCKETLKIKYYYRYMDDIVILHEDKKTLHMMFYKIKKYLKKELKLEIKNTWQIFESRKRGIDFVGYRNFGNYILLRKKTSQSIRKKMTKILKKVSQNKLINYGEYCSINSYKGWIKWCNGYNLSQKYLLPLSEPVKKYYKEVIKGESTRNNGNSKTR